MNINDHQILEIFYTKDRWAVIPVETKKPWRKSCSWRRIPQKIYVLYTHVYFKIYMFTYRHTQLSVTYTNFHKIKTKSHNNNIHRKKAFLRGFFFFLMIEKLNWRVKREMQKYLLKGSIRKKVGGGINIVKGTYKVPWISFPKKVRVTLLTVII